VDFEPYVRLDDQSGVQRT